MAGADGAHGNDGTTGDAGGNGAHGNDGTTGSRWRWSTW